MANIGNIEPRDMVREMEESYLDYAMSVIVQRALPDVRDGLKPVHRRILFTMSEMGLNASSRFRKSAAVVGEVLGKYHPHSDTAVYDAMARLAQDFNMRYQLVWGQGNFGSIDGDSPAAMRYTEAKMTRVASLMLEDINKNTVEWMDNYDGTRQEPKVLPAAVPQLLLNGALGIAVGMATNIPPHNLTEVVDASTHLIDNPKATTADLMNIVKGPDFPTGGNIYSKKAILEAYGQGKGPILMRGKADIKDPPKRGAIKTQYIEITEIPYQVNKSTLVEQMATLVQDGRLDNIKDIRDESDRTGLRIIIELKREAQPQKTLNKLYKFTELQKTFHLNMLALVDGIQPQVLTLKEVLEKYLEHKFIVVKRRTEFDLEAARARAHILEGLKKALDHIDEVIQTIRKSKDRADAHVNLRKTFKFSDLQTAAILEMRLQNLANLERMKVEEELKGKQALIKEYELLLANEKKMWAKIKQELIDVKAQYGDERRTKVNVQAPGEFSEEDLILKEETIVSITRGGYIKRVSPSNYRVQNRGGKGIIGMGTRGEDVIEHFFTASTHDRLLFFTNQGRVFQAIAYEIPESTRVGRGKALANFLDLPKEETVSAVIPLDRGKGSDAPQDEFLVMVTEGGIIKKTPLKDFENVRRNGLIALNIKKDDSLRWVGVSSGKDELLLVTRNGQAIHFKESDVRPMGRTAAGVKAIALKGRDAVVGMNIIHPKTANDVLMVTQNGFGKKTAVALFKVQKRGGSGIKAAKVTDKTGALVSVRMIAEEEELIVISAKGHVIRVGLKNIPKLSRATQGVRVMRLADGDHVASVAAV
ncbi:MAG: DNA gyrase subunit A [Candidatus Spechtbacterales bacterium]